MRAACGAFPSPPVTGGKNLSSLFVRMGRWLTEPALAFVRLISHNRIYRMSRVSASRQFVKVEGMTLGGVLAGEQVRLRAFDGGG